MDRSLIGDLVARDRRSGEPALIDTRIERVYSYFDFCNTANKVANVLRHVGVRQGDRIRIMAEPERQPILTFFGAAQVGSVVLFAEANDTSGTADIRAIVHPTTNEADIETAGPEREICYGDRPAKPGATHWETEVWSENPATVPAEHNPADAMLETVPEGERYSHERLLRAARGLASKYDIGQGTSVALEAPLTDPRAVVAGVVAPVLVGGNILLADDDVSKAEVVVAAQEQRDREPARIPIEAVEI